MCVYPQTTDDAIVYKHVVPRTVRLISTLPGRDAPGTEKLEQTRGFPWIDSTIRLDL